MTGRRWLTLIGCLVAAGLTVGLAVGSDKDDDAGHVSEFTPVEGMTRDEVEAQLGASSGDETFYTEVETPHGPDGPVTTAWYDWGSVDYVDDQAVGWVEGATP